LVTRKNQENLYRGSAYAKATDVTGDTDNADKECNIEIRISKFETIPNVQEEKFEATPVLIILPLSII
jgi:hypothetical protein